LALKFRLSFVLSKAGFLVSIIVSCMVSTIASRGICLSSFSLQLKNDKHTINKRSCVLIPLIIS
ncbi:hypothetical protein, partial [Lacinutrix sp.]|uniref:hypothetical protein n=1 Tax=Lacinutrix sp. TaxID=1937692 RepID=UPI0025BE70AF